MTFRVKAWTKDERPERTSKDQATPEGGFKAKTGIRKASAEMQIATDSPAEALEKAGKAAAKMEAASAAAIVRITVERISEETSGNPFA